MKIASRPTEMLERQLAANRSAARDPDHHAHVPRYRAHFVREILAIRAELRRRRREPRVLLVGGGSGMPHALITALSRSTREVTALLALPPLPYQTGDGRRFATEQAARAHVNHVHRTTGTIIAIERVE